LASKIFACFLLLLASVWANDPHWSWYPMNSVHFDGEGRVVRTQSGMQFYFCSAPASTVNVSALVVDAGQDRKVDGTLDTDTNGNTFLRFPIRTLDGFRVKYMVLTFGSHRVSFDNPEAGKQYAF